MNKQIKDLSVNEIKIAVFDYSEQLKHCNITLEALYKALPERVKLEQEEAKISKLASEQAKEAPKVETVKAKKLAPVTNKL